MAAIIQGETILTLEEFARALLEEKLLISYTHRVEGKHVSLVRALSPDDPVEMLLTEASRYEALDDDLPFEERTQQMLSALEAARADAD